MRHLGGAATPADPAELTGEDIKALREQANLSQAVFASS
jgi:putative transcriptional regulator